jgi:hypothetical protein
MILKTKSISQESKGERRIIRCSKCGRIIGLSFSDTLLFSPPLCPIHIHERKED